MIKLWKSIMAGLKSIITRLKVMFAKKSPYHYFAQNTIDLHEAPKLGSILVKYEYDLSDTIEKEEDSFNEKKKRIATQIAPTPILTGNSAKQVLNQIRVKPSEETKRGTEILFDMFEGKEKGNDEKK